MFMSFFLIIIGFCLWGASAEKDVHEVDEPAGTVVKEWEVSGNFTEGDIMYISMTQGLNWAELVDPEPPGYKWVYLNVSDSRGGFIVFEVEYVKSQRETGPPLNPTYVRIEENSSDCLKLLWKNQTSFSGGVFIVGRVLVNGTYSVKVVDFDPSAGDEYPPASLQLRRKWLIYTSPYLSLFYFGVAVIVLGVCTLIFAFSRHRKSKSLRFKK
jgi:hypothetical protein